MWHSICIVQGDEAMLSGQAGEAGSTGAQLLAIVGDHLCSARPIPDQHHCAGQTGGTGKWLKWSEARDEV